MLQIYLPIAGVSLDAFASILGVWLFALFAQRRALSYGLFAVAGAAMAGWLASLPFRNA